jgi:hypothetical protein
MENNTYNDFQNKTIEAFSIINNNSINVGNTSTSYGIDEQGGSSLITTFIILLFSSLIILIFLKSSNNID